MKITNNHWLDKKAYPFESHYFAKEAIHQHYVDEGVGEILLFVHGTPSWSFDFRHIIKAFSKNYRCIAPDHIGFGLSDKPANYDYSTPHHADRLASLIEHLQLKNITLIVHDFGGAIAFPYAIRNSENISKLIILNSWLWSSASDPDFIKFSSVLKSPLLPFLYRQLNFSVRFLLPQSFGVKKLSRQTLKQYTSPFKRKAERNGTLAFAKSLLTDQPWFEELWTQAEVVIAKPTLLIWGMKDRFVKPHYLEKFASRFSHATKIQLQTCGHFPQEEEPEAVTTAISEFMKSV